MKIDGYIYLMQTDCERWTCKVLNYGDCTFSSSSCTDLIWCYKIVFGTVNIKFGHEFKLYKQYSDNNTRNFFFTERIINIWNTTYC